MKFGAPIAWGIGRAEASALLLSAGAIAAAVTFQRLGSDAYKVVPGVVNPVVTTVAACLLGLAGLRILGRRRWCQLAGASRESYLAAVLLGTVLPIPMLVVDVLGGFPRALNVSAPASFLFYPAVAVVAEFIFHVTPLAFVAVAAALVSEADERARTVAMTVAALPEPVLQVAWGAAHSPAWANGCVGLQLLIFNLIGLRLFQRHGFFAAYLYRLSYYLVWHILWGYLRLGVLFGR